MSAKPAKTESFQNPITHSTEAAEGDLAVALLVGDIVGDTEVANVVSRGAGLAVERVQKLKHQGALSQFEGE